MKLNHINLVVSNVEEVASLFETYFNFRRTTMKGNNIIAVLKGSDDFTLVIMVNKDMKTIYPDAFHIGFMLDDPMEVTEIYKKLINGGITMRKGLKKIKDSFGFYFTYDDITIEVGL
jgi:catechol-2,3-dioxygenase